MTRSFYCKMPAALAIFSAICLMEGCRTNDKKSEEDGITEELFFDYQVTAKEGDDNLTIMLQYRDGGEEGDGIYIPLPGKITLDGEALLADSTKMTGVFYELHKPIETFTGKHSISFTADKNYNEEFEFKPVILLTQLPDTLQRGDLIFEFDGLDPKDNVRILMTDTSFINNGINKVERAIDGRLVITREDLESLASGPVQAEFIREYERPVRNGTATGGRLLVTYSLKREFILKN